MLRAIDEFELWVDRPALFNDRSFALTSTDRCRSAITKLICTTQYAAHQLPDYILVIASIDFCAIDDTCPIIAQDDRQLAQISIAEWQVD